MALAVEIVEGGGHFRQVDGHPVRLPQTGGSGHLVREISQLAQEVPLRRGGEQHHVRGLVRVHALLGGGPQDGADAGVGVLHVVDRVVVALFLGQIQIEVQQGIGAAHDEKEAGRVLAHVVDELVQGDETAGALGHLHHFAVFYQAHELHEDDLQLVAAVAQSFHGALHAGHVAVMVGAPDVDDRVEAALELVFVVGDVGGEIGGHAVPAHQHLGLHVRTHTGAVDPDGVVLRQQPAPFVQLFHGGFHLAGIVERALGEPAVVGDAEAFQRAFDGGQFVFQAVLGQIFFPQLLADVHVFVADLAVELLHQLFEIGAGIAVLRELVVHAAGGEIAAVQSAGEFVDLVARVVDIVFPFHLEAGHIQHGGQGIADGGAPGVAHVQVAGGVGGDEFHLDLLALAQAAAAEILAFGQHLAGGLVQPVLFHAEIDETGAGDLHFFDGGIAEIYIFGNGLGDVAGRFAAGLGQQHGHVGRVVAVGGFPRAFHRVFGQFLIAEVSGYPGADQRVLHPVADELTAAAHYGIVLVHAYPPDLRKID